MGTHEALYKVYIMYYNDEKDKLIKKLAQLSTRLVQTKSRLAEVRVLLKIEQQANKMKKRYGRCTNLECSQPFIAARSTKKFCSVRCQLKVAYQHRKHREEKRKQRNKITKYALVYSSNPKHIQGQNATKTNSL